VSPSFYAELLKHAGHVWAAFTSPSVWHGQIWGAPPTCALAAKLQPPLTATTTVRDSACALRRPWGAHALGGSARTAGLRAQGRACPAA